MKLELKHIAPYLPYGLKICFQQGKSIWSISFDEIDYENRGYPLHTLVYSINQGVQEKDWGLILRPLSDLLKEIEYNGEKFVPLDELQGIYFENHCDAYDEYIEHLVDAPKWAILAQAPYEILQVILQWKFDVFSLIPEGLAVDVNTLEVNPYK